MIKQKASQNKLLTFNIHSVNMKCSHATKNIYIFFTTNFFSACQCIRSSQQTLQTCQRIRKEIQRNIEKPSEPLLLLSGAEDRDSLELYVDKRGSLTAIPLVVLVEVEGEERSKCLSKVSFSLFLSPAWPISAATAFDPPPPLFSLYISPLQQSSTIELKTETAIITIRNEGKNRRTYEIRALILRRARRLFHPYCFLL